LSTVSEKQTTTSVKVEPTDADDIELEASLQQLLLDLLRDAVETNVASGEDSVPLGHRRGHGGLVTVA